MWNIWLLIYCFPIIFCIVIFFMARRNSVQGPFFYAIAESIYRRYQKKLRNPGIEDKIRQIHPLEKSGELIDRYYVNKIKIVLVLLVAVSVLALTMTVISGKSGNLEDGGRIARNSYGKGKKQVRIIGTLNDITLSLPFDVKERQFSGKELEEMFPGYLLELEKKVLGENKDREHISHDLNLVQGLEGYPFYNDWSSSRPELIDYEGKHMGENSEQPLPVIITLTASYLDWQGEYQFPVRVVDKNLSMEEKTAAAIKKALAQAEDDSGEMPYLVLPETVESRPVLWKEEKGNTAFPLFILGIVATVLAGAGMDRDLFRQTVLRRVQMEEDYPEIVSKISLLMGAGMALRMVLEKMAADYGKRKRAGGNLRFAYEELILTCNELNSGITERQAYENLGKRSGIKVYLRLSSLLIQNGKKGNSGMLKLLKEETEEAFREKKSAARKKGEEAGTKLLLPMMVLLAIVMVIITIPAFYSFGI